MYSELQSMKKIEKQVDEMLQRIDKSGYPITDEIRETAKTVVEKMISENVSPMEVLNFTPNMIETIYTYSYNLFRAGKYEEALPLFKLLHSLNPFDARYPFSAGACYHYLKNYTRAAEYYIESAGLDPGNPLSFFYLSDCFRRTGNPTSAYHAIRTAIALAESDPKYAEFKEKVQPEADALEKEMQEYFAKNFESNGG